MRKKLVKFFRSVFELCEQTHRQTDRRTDIQIAILYNPTGVSNKIFGSWMDGINVIKY